MIEDVGTTNVYIIFLMSQNHQRYLDNFCIFWQVIGQVGMHRIEVRLLLHYFEEFAYFQQSKFILSFLLFVWELLFDLALVRANESFFLVFEVSIQTFKATFLLQIQQYII